MANRRAIISVYDKTGVVEFARELGALGFEIISTGGTARALTESGVPVIPVTQVTGFPEILDGRVKTLHPRLHGGILAKNDPRQLSEIKSLGIEAIDLVAVNLYPFSQVVSRPGATPEEIIENIDIGGPAMVRAAAKNYERVVVVVNPGQYEVVIRELKEKGEVGLETRRRLAAEAFAHTRDYDEGVARYFARLAGLPEAETCEGVLIPRETEAVFPEVLEWRAHKIYDLRYGENPHQGASFYRLEGGGIASACQIQGKELSYNNIVDVDAAWGLVGEFAEPAAVIIKHTNPCGVALGHDLREACVKALEADPVSAFGGIVGLNRPVDEHTAEELSRIFLEVIVAPEYTEEALRILGRKENLRLLKAGEGDRPPGWDFKRVSGGLLVQESDAETLPPSSWKAVTRAVPSQEQMEDLWFAWRVVKYVKSNAIVVAKNKATVGIGAGQMNRVGAARIALEQAGGKARGAVMASDAFFPFRDVVDEAARAGIVAIVQPGGSIHDEESIRAAEEHGLAMVFTGRRHFRH